MYISEDDKKKILDRTSDKLAEVIGQFTTLSKHGTGQDLFGTCPICGSDKFGINENKRVFRCHKCQQISGKTPIDYLMKGKNYSFPDALKWLADYFNILLSEPPKREPKKKLKDKISRGKKKDGSAWQSYCARMLQESGLTFEDVTAKIFHQDKNKTVALSPTFFAGTVDSHGNIDRTGDDAVIAYYDLEGLPITYEQKDAKGRLTGKTKEYFRIRWQFPDEHLDKEGKPFKYKSPYGAATYVYIPERIRERYRKAEPIPRLFIQEGEKKAEKACKHGIMSVAISGIGNIATNKRLPEDIIKIISVCKVQEVVFLLDSDWQDISANIKINDRVDKRPRNFFYAVKNFREYFRSLKNRELYVEIYFGHVRKNPAQDKGIDDLLANTLSGKENELLEDIDYCMNEKDLAGKYVQFHKITTCTDYKLEELWCLHSPNEFARLHKDILKDLPEFLIGRNRWRFNDKGELESAQPIESDEKYWDEIEKRDRDGNTRITYEFKYKRSRIFLHNRGFGRYQRLDNTFDWIHLDPPTVTTVQPWEIRDYLEEFTEMNAPEDFLEMIIKGGPQYLGPDKLSGLPFIVPNFTKPERDKQMFYFSNICWEIVQDGVKELHYSNISNHIWKDERNESSVTLLKSPLIQVSQDAEGKWFYIISPEGQRCNFLQFLVNTSNFTWRKKRMIDEGNCNITLDTDEEYENIVHLVSKLCAIGYMLMDCKDKANARAVVAMDGKQSEVGASNGRSGKSLVGEAFKHVRKSVVINGKNSELAKDNFLWDEVTEKTKVVFIDDVRAGFDLEFLFANITGDWTVNYKGGRRCTFPFSQSPKIYITTNHALKGDGSSFRARQWIIAFSDYYNDNFSPLDDFGQLFFDEWDFEQWNLFWNLLATCVQLYLKHGYVASPGERIEIRKLRQEMTEEFLSWAEEYFSDPAKRNVQLVRKELYDAFLTYVPEQRKYCSPTAFKRRIIKYCEYKGYLFNPQKYDRITGLPIYLDKDGNPVIDDKSSGVEYFTIGDDNFVSDGTTDNLLTDFTENNEQLF